MGKNSRLKSRTNVDTVPKLETVVTIFGVKVGKDRLSSYTQDDLKKFHREQISKGKDFSSYNTKIYSDRVDFKPNGKSRLLKVIRFANIIQIAQVEADKNSVFLRIGNTRTSKIIVCLVHFHQIQDACIFLQSVDQYTASTLRNSTDSNTTEEAATMENQIHKRYSSEWRRSGTRQRRRSCSDCASDTELLVDANSNSQIPFNQSYTSYCPDEEDSEDILEEYISKSDYSERKFPPTNARESNIYNNYELRSEDDVCRDRYSVFYGERMSPTSQYVDDCFRKFIHSKVKLSQFE